MTLSENPQRNLIYGTVLFTEVYLFQIYVNKIVCTLTPSMFVHLHQQIVREIQDEKWGAPPTLPKKKICTYCISCFETMSTSNRTLPPAEFFSCFFELTSFDKTACKLHLHIIFFSTARRKIQNITLLSVQTWVYSMSLRTVYTMRLWQLEKSSRFMCKVMVFTFYGLGPNTRILTATLIAELTRNKFVQNKKWSKVHTKNGMTNMRENCNISKTRTKNWL